MRHFAKPNATGRSSGKRSGRSRKIYSPPKGEPWRWLTRELISSPAWRMRSINVARLIDFLLVEDMNHAGTENGNLNATYDQLCEWGIGRRHIRPAIEEAQFLGLLHCEQGVWHGGKFEMNCFRLTFYPYRQGYSATNEWKGKTTEAIKVWRLDKANMRAAKKQNSSSRSCTVPVPFRALEGGKSEKTRN